MSRSARLRKYGAVYRQYMLEEREKLGERIGEKIVEKREKASDRKREEKHEQKIEPRADRKTVKKHEKTEKTEQTEKESKTRRKKPEPNDYQVFYQLESSKEKYKQMPGKERMKNIAKEWDKKKRQRTIAK